MSLIEFLEIFTIALGTYLFRYLPLKTSLLRKKSGKDDNNLAKILEISGISIISALLTSSLHDQISQIDWLAMINICLSSGAVLMLFKRTNNSGVSVLVGIAVYALLQTS